jgi:competence protein ComEA
MPTFTRSQLVFDLLAAWVVIVLGVRATRAAAPPAADAPPHARPEPPRTIRIERQGARRAVVHVVGAVRRPGVYRLHAAARVADAVRRAGGPRPRADLAAVNLAARVADGQQIVVPARTRAVSAAPPAAGAPTHSRLDAPVDLNTATAEQLDELDGVGPVTAQKILAWRREHGPFRSAEDLAQIAGIGPKRLAALRPQVRP